MRLACRHKAVVRIATCVCCEESGRKRVSGNAELKNTQQLCTFG